MYNVVRQNHTKYGSVVEIALDDAGENETPFQAFNKAKTMRRLWLESGEKKVRILVNGKVMTVAQAEQWSNEEYKSLPKCEACAKILRGDVYTHKFCGSNLFCSQACADKDYAYQMEKLSDEEECDCF
jgi:hypothetical protein